MFCKRCGKQVDETARFCAYCGSSTEEPDGRMPPLPREGAPSLSGDASGFDAPSAGYAVLGFFFPIVGLILFLVWRDQYPFRARSCGKGALINVIVGVIVGVLAVSIGFIVAAATILGALA